MMNRTATLAAVAALQAAITQAGEAFQSLRDEVANATTEAYRQGGGHHQTNTVGHIVGDYRLELELVGLMVDNRLGPLFAAVDHAGGIGNVKAVEDLQTIWAKRVGLALASVSE